MSGLSRNPRPYLQPVVVPDGLSCKKGLLESRNLCWPALDTQSRCHSSDHAAQSLALKNTRSALSFKPQPGFFCGQADWQKRTGTFPGRVRKHGLECVASLLESSPVILEEAMMSWEALMCWIKGPSLELRSPARGPVPASGTLSLPV